MLIISDRSYFLDAFENLGEACASSLKVDYKCLRSGSKRSALAIMRFNPDISLVVCDTMHQGYGFKAYMSNAAAAPKPDNLGPVIADALRQLYPNLKIVGVPCCDFHGQDWMAQDRKYDIIHPFARRSGLEQLESLVQETLGK
jgi:hypothetical protein